jgi:hypothetical protein
MKEKTVAMALIASFLWGSTSAFAFPVKLRTTCNGCSDLAMADTARSMGEGEHLVLDVTSQTFRIYEVFCAGGGGGGHVRSTLRGACTGVSNPVEQVPTAADHAAFAEIRDALTPGGAIQKNVAVQVSSPRSVYELGHNNNAANWVRAQLEDSLWPLVREQMGWTAQTGLRWLGTYMPVFPNSEPNKIVVQVNFSDGSSMPAEINIEGLLSLNPVLPVVTLDTNRARDAEGRRIPGLNLALPDNTTGPLEVFPSNREGFEALMAANGYRTVRPDGWGWGGSGNGGSNHGHYRCQMRMVDENDPSQGSETVCIKYQ